MSVSELGVSRDVFVFCQLTGNEISAASCLQTQGQDGCFGCASPVRHCTSCDERYVAVPATGMCSICTIEKLAEEQPISLASLPEWIENCALHGRSVHSKLCRATQGEPECKGCIAASRQCEKCQTNPVVFQEYGYCLACSLSELQPDWHPDVPDRDVESISKPTFGAPSLPVGEEGDVITSLAREMRRVPLSQIEAPEYQLRREVDETALDELGQSMVDDTIIQLPVLEQIGDQRYRVVIGSRRIASARRQGAIDLPALIITEELDPLDRLVIMLAENSHRVDLDPLEEGRVFVKLQTEYGLSVKKIAAKSKKPTYYVTERVQLLSMPDEVQSLVVEGNLGIKHTAVLARVADASTQVSLAEESVANRLSVAQLRKRVVEEEGASRDEPKRVAIHKVTPKKAIAQVRGYTDWLRRASARLREQSMTPEEGLALLDALGDWSEEAEKLETFVTSGELRLGLRHGAEWNSEEERLILAGDRPPDDELAQQLRRTIGAIRAKRKKLQE